MTRHLAAGHGFRQFLDNGTGLPTSPNLHGVTQQVDPSCRVVYMDNDPIVLTHARALVTSAPEGRMSYVDAYVRDADAILAAPEVRQTLDADRPIALTLIVILQFIPDEEQAQDIVRQLLELLPSGSAFALSTVTADSAPEEIAAEVASYTQHSMPMKARTKPEAERFFDGLELLFRPRCHPCSALAPRCGSSRTRRRPGARVWRR